MSSRSRIRAALPCGTPERTDGSRTEDARQPRSPRGVRRAGTSAPLNLALRGLRPHVRIAIDDAGAGYAGLQHILEIEPDIVKLDITLTRSVDSDRRRRALVASIVGFACETGCTVLAEGIETETELAALRELGVALGQGYLLARPAPIESLVLRAAS